MKFISNKVVMLAAMLLLIGIAAPAFAAMYPVSNRWMINHSEVVVTGKIVSISSDYEADGLIWSYATLDVEHRVMGITNDQIVFKYQGGTVGDITMGVSVSPIFSAGEEVLVFLKTADDGKLEVSNWSLSKYTLENGVFIENGKEYHEYIDELTQLVNSR